MPDSEGIRKLARALKTQWNRHDVKGFAGLFAQDADFTNVVGATAHGRDEIEKFHTAPFATQFHRSQMAVGEQRTRWLSADLAWVDIPWSMTGAVDKSGAERPPRSGTIHAVVSKGKEAWEFSVFANQELTLRT
ncbi:MAG: SgcJ/EcaC family oxidoreductase [Thermoplasmata archaeon]